MTALATVTQSGRVHKIKSTGPFECANHGPGTYHRTEDCRDLQQQNNNAARYNSATRSSSRHDLRGGIHGTHRPPSQVPPAHNRGNHRGGRGGGAAGGEAAGRGGDRNPLPSGNNSRAKSSVVCDFFLKVGPYRKDCKALRNHCYATFGHLPSMLRSKPLATGNDGNCLHYQPPTTLFPHTLILITQPLTSRLRILHCLRFLRVLRVLPLCRLLRRLLPRSRPLVLSSRSGLLPSITWHLWLLRGLQDSRTGLLPPSKTHFPSLSSVFSLSLRRTLRRPRLLLSAQRHCRLRIHRARGTGTRGSTPIVRIQFAKIPFEVTPIPYK